MSKIYRSDDNLILNDILHTLLDIRELLRKLLELDNKPQNEDSNAFPHVDWR